MNKIYFLFYYIKQNSNDQDDFLEYAMILNHLQIKKYIYIL